MVEWTPNDDSVSCSILSYSARVGSAKVVLAAAASARKENNSYNINCIVAKDTCRKKELLQKNETKNHDEDQ